MPWKHYPEPLHVGVLFLKREDRYKIVNSLKTENRLYYNMISKYITCYGTVRDIA